MTQTSSSAAPAAASGPRGGAPDQAAELPPSRRAGLDVATIAGLAVAAGLIAATMLIGGSPGAYLDSRSTLIVLLGTAAVTAISFPPSDLAALPAVMSRGLLRRRRRPKEIAEGILGLAEHARKEGTLSLDMTAKKLRGEPFASRALLLVADSNNAAEVESVLTAERDSRYHDATRSAAVLRRSGDVAPAMGLIGTLVGLVQMLSGLEDPSTIGPAMAVALLTTLYGAILGHVVLHPLAQKLDIAADEDTRLDHLYLLGATSMARQENPRRLETLLNAALPAGERVRYFD